jgi:hypothetical protein
MLAAAAASPATAQMKLEVAATIGQYAPFGDFAPATVHSTGLPRSPSDLSGVALGGELRLWIAPRFGFALTGTTVSSTLGSPSNNPNSPFPDPHSPVGTSARVSTASAALLYQVTNSDHRARIWLEAGGAVVRHGGAVYEPFGSPVNFGGIAGVASAIRLPRPLSLELGVRTLVYRMNMHGTAATDPRLLERGTQADAQFYTGLSVSWR